MHQLPALRAPTQTTGPFPLDGQDSSNMSRNQIKRVLDSAPKVYWNRATQITRIAMMWLKYIEGRLVSEVCPHLSEEARYDINQQLYGFVRQLQSLKMDSPGPIGGGVSKGAFFTDYGAGPFTSKNDIEM
ncbi:hypothetical protein ACJ73_06378 [Blastomyces percursus]|uniref:Uncharacterized protein n=1 Tax=Blastomyces percursus TaxID=1658174 RepID=A0A1J9R3T1_9EURO|nr:hypothetical protein ACJ73_06378 [Blastomyces percursus]